jgi:hypothetical protein
MRASEYIGDSSYLKNENPVTQIQIRHELLQEYLEKSREFERLFDIQGNLLSSETVTSLMVFLDATDELVDKLTYFTKIYDPKNSHMDFVFNPPFEAIFKIEQIFARLRKVYPDFEKHINKNKPMLGAQEIKEKWFKSEKDLSNLFLQPSKYICSSKDLYTYDIETFRHLTGDGPPSVRIHNITL